MSGIKHAFQSAKSDGGDTTLVRPSNWNAEHTIAAGGTSFPGSPADDDMFYRSDLDEWFRYESTGTKWLCSTLHELVFTTRTAIGSGITGTTASIVNAATLGSAGDMWVEDFIGMLFATATNDGSNYWTIDLVKLTDANSATVIATLSTQSNTASNWVQETATVDDYVVGSTHKAFRIDINKVGSSNSIIPTFRVTWRHAFDV